MTASRDESANLLQLARKSLSRLSPDRLRVAVDFLEYLERREQDEATLELLRIPGISEAFAQAAEEIEERDIVPFKDVRRDV
jgi:hypothetical protein